MLYAQDEPRDTDTVRAWLVKALQAGSTRGLTRAGLARHCGVTVQAVDGWQRTGRITKTNLAKAENYFGHGPVFARSATNIGYLRERPQSGKSPPWPFTSVSPAEIASLPQNRLQRLERMVRSRLDEWREDDDAGRTPPAAGDNAAPGKRRRA